MEQIKNVFKMPSRQGQLWALILLSAATMIVPYGIQGALSSGKDPSQISSDIWLLDNIAWAIRAMVEGLVIAYIARTRANNSKEATWLWVAEGALVALIMLTLGPTLFAALNGVAIKEALPVGVQWAWALGLASYMPLMVLGASYAYKVQPYDEEAQVVDNEQVAQLERHNENLYRQVAELEHTLEDGRNDYHKLERERAQLTERLSILEVQAKPMQDWQLLSPTAKAVWVAQHANGDRPPAGQLAQALGVATSTISRAYKKVDDAKGEAGQ